MIKIDSLTRLFGVVGSPVVHSLGPVMHNAAFEAVDLNALYLAFESRDISGCLRGMKALGIKGMSVTIPHKSTVIPFLDQVDDMAAKIGAVNTIVNQEGKLVGYNTDALGALKAIEAKMEISGKTCLILGAGGAARAIGFILMEHGAAPVIVNRTPERGKALAEDLGCPFLTLDQLGRVPADLLIQTTPVGMTPRPERSPVPEEILRRGMAVMDIIYNPLETRLLSMAGEKGCLTIDGLGMFIHQGAEQFRLWTGLEPPLEVMARVVKQALGE
jgi:shikimate dehydrogenase